ncbi:MAG: fibrillarin-like rRNA/tRNA 2'-O-methyltransferase, partial [Candidatus Odinarchaeia archaeon]
MVKISQYSDFDGVYEIRDGEKVRLATINLVPGIRVYDETLIKFNSEELRTWDPFRSKLSAAILSGLKKLPIKTGSKILYLGAASGTTCSHISDIIRKNGRIYCVEFSPRSIRKLVSVCEERKNMFPILADARFPEKYGIFTETVDLVYADLAQPDQAKILINNCNKKKKKDGHFMIAIKARSIDVTK